MNNNIVKKVLEIGASWCAPCKAYAPVFKRVSEMEEFKDVTFETLEIDDDEDHDLEVEKLGIKSVPTTILLDENNEPIYKLMGNVPEKDLIELITKCLNER
jgi:thiol-disulfide isomerase/thioredoxin